MLEIKGSMYSDRELTTMVKLVGWGDTLLFSQPGAYLRQQRAFMRKLLGTHEAVKQHHPVLEDESHRFLRQVLSGSDSLAECIRHFAASTVLKITYGYTADEKNDPFIFNAERSNKELILATSLDSPWMVDIFTTLEKLPGWLPGMRFKKLAKKWNNHFQEYTNAPFQFVKEQIAAGTSVPSFTSSFLANSNITANDEHAIKSAAIGIYSAGSDTTVSVIQGFFLIMALNPSALKAAQEEIDAVIGTQRLPSISDRMHLPYTNALICELYRWNVPAPTAVPHKTSQDDVHAGHFIPKGSLVLPNLCFMMKDPRLFKDPERFIPERFLGESPEKDPREIIFGFGRRQCPGRLLADETVFIACAMSIAVFDIRKKSKDGVVIEPVFRMTTGLVSYPEPYEIDVRPRSSQAVALVQAPT